MLFQEQQRLVQFKINTKCQGKNLPDVDQELLRHLYATNFDYNMAYDSIKNYQDYM